MVAISLAPPALLWSELDPNERLFPAERVATAAAEAEVEVKAEVEVAAALIFWYVRPVQQPLPLF